MASPTLSVRICSPCPLPPGIRVGVSDTLRSTSQAVWPQKRLPNSAPSTHHTSAPRSYPRFLGQHGKVTFGNYLLTDDQKGHLWDLGGCSPTTSCTCVEAAGQYVLCRSRCPGTRHSADQNPSLSPNTLDAPASLACLSADTVASPSVEYTDQHWSPPPGS